MWADSDSVETVALEVVVVVVVVVAAAAAVAVVVHAIVLAAPDRRHLAGDSLGEWIDAGS